jgi:DNA-binding FadR family transcriptional regulator
MSQSTTAPVGLAIPTRSRLVDQVVEILTDAVVDGRFPPGSTLPPERDLAEQLGVNRTSLRQALSRVEQLGLIRTRHGSGTVVLDPVDNPDPRVVARLLEHADPALVGDLFEVRAGVVAMAARLAAERANGPDVERLRHTLTAVAEARTAGDRQTAEMAWFAALVDASHNRALTLLERWVARAYSGAAAHFESAFADADGLVRGLAEVVRAVEAHEPSAAERAMLDDATRRGALMAAAFGRATATGPGGRAGS